MAQDNLTSSMLKFLCKRIFDNFLTFFLTDRQSLKINNVISKLQKGASSTRFDGWSVRLSVGPSKKCQKKILQLENDLSEQILENESYSGS